VPRGAERIRLTPSPLHDSKMIADLVDSLDMLWSRMNLRRAA
jgi:5-aminolevulinate synthase